MNESLLDYIPPLSENAVQEKRLRLIKWGFCSLLLDFLKRTGSLLQHVTLLLVNIWDIRHPKQNKF